MALPPEDLDALRSVLNARYGSLPRRLAQVARHVLDHPDDVAFGPVASVATAAGVTPSTLIRFAQFLGYDGFSALQVIFQDSVRARIPQGASRKSGMKGATREAAVFYETIETCHHSLDTLSSTICVSDITAAADILSAANCLFILAGHNTFPLAVLLQHCLTRSGIRSTLLTDIAGGDDVLAFATPDDAAVVLGSAPYAGEMTARATLLADRGIPVIAVTDSDFSPLRDIASVRLRMIGPDRDGFLPATAGIALSEALAICIRQIRRDAAHVV